MNIKWLIEVRMLWVSEVRKYLTLFNLNKYFGFCVYVYFDIKWAMFI
jgi:hypothetical protein